MVAYCERSDVYAAGLPPEAFVRPPRALDGAPGFASGVLSARSHGLAADSPITFAVLSSSTLGAPAAALPGGLSVGVQYYARPQGSDLFQVATAVSPATPISSFSSEGAGVFAFILDHGVYLDAAIVAASVVIDQYARAHAAPIQSDALPFVCAFLAARIYVATHRALIPEAKAGEAEAPSWIRSLIDRLFAAWLDGAPIQGARDATPTQAENGATICRPRHAGPFRAPIEPIGGAPHLIFAGERFGDPRFRV